MAWEARGPSHPVHMAWRPGYMIGMVNEHQHDVWKTMENHGKPWKTMENHGKPWKTMEEIKVDLPKFFEKYHGVTPVVGFWMGISWVEHGKLSMFWAELRDHGRLKTFSWEAPIAFLIFFS